MDCSKPGLYIGVVGVCVHTQCLGQTQHPRNHLGLLSSLVGIGFSGPTEYVNWSRIEHGTPRR